VSSFEFDKTFAPESTQAQVFEAVQPLVISVLDGYNVCIFAYGQTGSGKTHTMEGPDHDPGVNRRAIQELFVQIEERSSMFDFELQMSMLEIYNEEIKDLLDPVCYYHHR
jgi:kinesin family protein C2/C3